MKQKLILRSDALPEHLQAELQAMESSLVAKYGPAAMALGGMLENVANVCNMVRSELSPVERELAYERSREVMADVMSLTARLLNVSRETTLAVALAYRDFGQRAEEEILGTAETLQPVESEALAVIAKAKL